MNFQLNEYNRNVSDSELINDVKRVAELLGLTTISMERYTQHGKFHHSTIARRFGGWGNVLTLSGLQINKNMNISEPDIISDIKRVAELLAKNSFTSKEYECYGKYSRTVVFRKLKTWNNALELSGLQKSSNKNTPDEELLNEIECIWRKLGRQPTTDDIKNGISAYSLNTFSRRFGGWRKALLAFVEYINAEEDDAQIDSGDVDSFVVIGDVEIN